MIAANPTLARRALVFGLAALLGGLFASQVSAAVVCQKTSKKGKHSFKIRDACLTEKGEVAVNVGTRTTVFHTFTDDDAQVLIDGPDIALPIDGVNTTFSFETTAESSDVVIAFTAGCSGSDASGGGWVDVDVNLNSAPLAPSNLPRNGFCFQTGAGDEVRHTASYSVAAEDLPAGTHSIEVLASNVSFSDGLGPFLGDVSLVVTVHEN